MLSKYTLHSHTKSPALHTEPPNFCVTCPCTHPTYILRLYIAQAGYLRRHMHSHTVRTPCPHLSSPSLLSAQPNSIRHSSHCRHGAHSVSRHAHHNWTTGLLGETLLSGKITHIFLISKFSSCLMRLFQMKILIISTCSKNWFLTSLDSFGEEFVGLLFAKSLRLLPL